MTDLPVVKYTAVITDIQRPGVQAGHMRAPVQIIVNLKQGNVTRKGPSTLHDKQMRLLIPIDDNMHLFKLPGTYVHVSKSLVD